ncbi:LysR family transcriptional regulator [bacterium]|nr:LysR family transcriptional regulator [bacterium]
MEQLRSFIKIAEMESFSMAANAVHLSQPSVSCQIIALEKELGTKLFDRLGKRIVLTKAGEILLQHAGIMVESEKKARLAINDILGIRKGEIKLGSSNIPGAYILLPFIQRFCKENPCVKIFSSIGDTLSIAQEVIDGGLDLGVIGSKINEDQLLYFDFIEDVMALALNASHPLAQKTSISLEEFLALPFIIREEGSGSRKAIEDELNKKGIRLNELNIVFQLGNTEAIKQGIKAGLGAAVISLCAILDEVKFGLMRHVAVEGLSFKRKFYIILHKTRSAFPLVEYFKGFLLENRQGL